MNAHHLNSLDRFSSAYVANLRRRFDAKWTPEPNTGCYIWFGARSLLGYGNIGVGGRRADGGIKIRAAHRIAYMLERGEIPQNKVLDHLCRNPSCVNPAHLEPVTNQENRKRGLLGDMRKTCKHGHDFRAPGALTPQGRCRACVNATMRAYKARRADRAEVTQ